MFNLSHALKMHVNIHKITVMKEIDRVRNGKNSNSNNCTSDN